ncbi:TonB-dependent receptor [Parasediminibacterium sp. JCM 36343]|uniref:TonB-dependent receptor n=1 Tax=Parasediminibacterium sp. JCM 36343 TaxID=3374279 RepID=UPI00397873E4
MYKRNSIFTFTWLLPLALLAQKQDSLQEITVQSFHYNKQWQDVPAAIAVINEKKLQQIGTSSLLSAINTVPGVRMEERSPISFRIAMRGSVLRSPFGVRNIKVYWNNMTLTDGGGNTYLNLIDVTQLSSVEIAKGAAASMYGAGTGGVVLLQTINQFTVKPNHQFTANINGGNFGLLQESVGWKYQNINFSSQLLQSHQQSDGYRQQSASHKDNLTWNASFKKASQQFDVISFYTRLYYQTPGGITLAQMQQNPTLARQPSGSQPGAVQQQAAIYNNTFFVGLHHQYHINRSFSTDAAIVLHHTLFKNPFITNYETRHETNMGANGKLIYQHQLKQIQLQWITGGEILSNHAIIEDDGNRGGEPDTIQLKDNTYSSQWFGFSQIQFTGKKWDAQFGVSANNQQFRYKRLTDGNTGFTHKNTAIVFMPRLSVGYKLLPSVTGYATIGKGFSPPSLQEIRPSNRVFNTELQPEYGWNAEIGFKGGLFSHRLLFDVNYYHFHLQNTIVTRNNTDGTQYFANTGTTQQNGTEVWLQYQLLKKPSKLLKAIRLSESYSYQPYRFINYQQVNSNFSGNRLTGVPVNCSVSSLSAELNKGWFMNISYNYTSSIPLTDANDAFANAYHLLQTKAGWAGKCKSTTIEIYVGGDNLLNEVYSLGNDINAVGKRFYNPAAGINFYGGCRLGFQ